MTSTFTTLLLSFILIISQFHDSLCEVHAKQDPAIRSAIFDPRVLQMVKTLFTRRIQTLVKTSTETGQKKSIIATTDMESSLHVKIDPHRFGNALLNQANENAERKSDIYMNKAIDATALGVAVLKLIFGKSAKMVMKDSTNDDTHASVRTSEPRPKTKSWRSGISSSADRKSLHEDTKQNSRGSSGIRKLSTNIFKLVKSLQPKEKATENIETKSVKDSSGEYATGKNKEKTFSVSNIQRLLSLMKVSKERKSTGNKKSWVLLKVPTKQPKDELGMLNDPATGEDGNDDDSSPHDHTGRMHVDTNEKHHKIEAKGYQSSKRLISKIQDQVEHLADIVTKQNSVEKEPSPIIDHHQRLTGTGQQSHERESLTTSRRIASKTLKSEPLQEVNAVKTDTSSYENSVRNLLKALQTSAQNHKLHHASRHEKTGRHAKRRLRKIKLVPVKRKEEQATSKDAVSGLRNPAGDAVVSLEALRQLGQLLGLSSQHDDEKRISPYTGTEDTLTLATPMPPEALQTTPTPTIPPTPPTVPPIPSAQNIDTNQESSLNRISEQLKMFAERGLRGHNDYRKLHHAEPLKWSEDLASAAEKLAYQAAKKGSTRRSGLVETKGYGENVAKIAQTALENAGEEATRHWYNEKQKFTFSDPVVDEQTKAFTQIIWKATKTLGMGAAKDDDTGELYVVALYSPKGNDQATLRENIVEDGKTHTDVYASIFKKSNFAS